MLLVYDHLQAYTDYRLRDEREGRINLMTPYHLDTIGVFEYWRSGNEVYRVNTHSKADFIDSYTGMPGGCRWECSYQHYLDNRSLYIQWAAEDLATA
jgi:hypothetical protein